ncbi:MAG: hypothetical protein EAZ16_05530 [Sphingobacteriales bacterium]|jgi:hypothetical protein|nr:MAG: hypothetical protein EAZ16_05530 [Sphingobacteriales bacterium]
MNTLVYVTLFIACFFAAVFVWKTIRLKSQEKRILDLEKEVLHAHAEILRLQQALGKLTDNQKDTKAAQIIKISTDKEFKTKTS